MIRADLTPVRPGGPRVLPGGPKVRLRAAQLVRISDFGFSVENGNLIFPCVHGRRVRHGVDGDQGLRGTVEVVRLPGRVEGNGRGFIKGAGGGLFSSEVAV